MRGLSVDEIKKNSEMGGASRLVRDSVVEGSGGDSPPGGLEEERASVSHRVGPPRKLQIHSIKKRRCAVPYTNEDEIWEREMNKTHFTGFPLDVIEEGMKVLADAVGSDSGKDAVLNGTSEGIQKGMKDPRPFVIQNHGSLKEICRVWNSE